MDLTADRVQAGASLAEAVAVLDADPARTLHGTAELQRWMQQRSDESLNALADEHFDVPAPIRRLECRIAPTTTGGIYYTGPSDDFSRPGRMWWSVPLEVTEFTTWREKTTVFHEGVPGHHLQVAQTVYRAELLFRAGLNPYTPGREVPEQTVRALWKDWTKLLKRGVELGQMLTIDRLGEKRYRSALAHRNERHYVYHRTGLPCRVCSTNIVMEEFGGRKLYWCPSCQA